MKFDVFRPCCIWYKVYKPIQKRWKHFRNGLFQQTLQRYIAFLDLSIIIISSLRNMHKWPNPYINWFQVRIQWENVIQLRGILSVRMLLTNLKSCALEQQVWHMQILRNHLNYIWMQAFSALELPYIKNKMELKSLLVLPVDHYQNQNQNIPSVSWNFFAWSGQ